MLPVVEDRGRSCTYIEKDECSDECPIETSFVVATRGEIVFKTLENKIAKF